MTYKDKASYESSPPCIRTYETDVCLRTCHIHKVFVASCIFYTCNTSYIYSIHVTHHGIRSRRVFNKTWRHWHMKQVGAHSSQFKPLQRPMALAKKLVALGAQSNTLAKEQSWKENMAAELDIEIEAPDAPDSGLSFLSHTPATHCNTLQHSATHCDTLQHTATHCNAPTCVSHRLTLKWGSRCPRLWSVFCHTIQRVVSQSSARVISHKWASHVTHLSESCHTPKRVISPSWVSHATHMSESRHTPNWVMSHT